LNARREICPANAEQALKTLIWWHRCFADDGERAVGFKLKHIFEKKATPSEEKMIK
jgi:hypothetical protein